MALRFYRKDILGNQIHINGETVKWEVVGASTGVRTFDETSEAALITELDKLADAKRKGVRRISPEQYESLKKNFKPAVRQNPLERIRSFNPEKVLPQRLRKPSESLVAPPVPGGNKPPQAITTSVVNPPGSNPLNDLPPNVIDTAADQRPKVRPRTMKKSELKAKEAKAETDKTE